MKRTILFAMVLLVGAVFGHGGEARPGVKKGQYFLSFWSTPPSESRHKGNGVRLEYGILKNLTLGVKVGLINTSGYLGSERVVAEKDLGRYTDEQGHDIGRLAQLDIRQKRVYNQGNQYALEGTYYVPLFAGKRLELFVRSGIEWLKLRTSETAIAGDFYVMDNGVRFRLSGNPYTEHEVFAPEQNVLRANFSAGLQYWVLKRLALGCSMLMHQDVLSRSPDTNNVSLSFQAMLRF